MHTLFVITTADREDPDKMPRQMWHFIRVYTVCQDKNDLQGKTAILFRNENL